MSIQTAFGCCSLIALLSLTTNVATAQEPAESSPTVTYLVVYKPGPSWLPGKTLAEQPLMEHGRYMLSLYAKGSMKFAGPFTDDAGGAVVLNVVDEAEAKALVAADPAVQSGIFVSEIHPWMMQPWDKYLERQKNRTSPQ